LVLLALAVMPLIAMNTVPSMPSKLLGLAVSPLHISPNGGTLVFSRIFFRFMMAVAPIDIHPWDSFQQ
jgi:hypothetical protein